MASQPSAFFQTLCTFTSKGTDLRRAQLVLIIILLFSAPGFSQEVNLNGNWRFHIGDKTFWASPDFDDSVWESIYAPSPWEEEGFNRYDGFAWYRKKFDGRKLNKDVTYYLGLGFIDDSDEVYLNGQLIGFSGHMPPKFETAFNKERKYPIPNDVLNFEGENTIAIRIYDVVHGGGIIDGDLGIYRADHSKFLIDLQGVWSFGTSWFGNPIKEENDWGKIIVPGAWEFQGFPKYDGFAWYRRTFTIPTGISTDGLVLLLGKIDDFDMVYLNGQLIGSTNDHRPYGSSGSYSRNRVYKIPSKLLKSKGSNKLEILVEDMGNIGGIYEGPVGITSRSNYERYFRD